MRGGQPNFNFMSTYWDYESNTLRVYLGRKYNSDFTYENNTPASITISLYDVRGVLSSQRIYNCDYTSEDYHENTNSFHIKLDKNDFYSSNTDVYLKIIVGVSSGTNWYERWYTPPIDWNQEAGTGGETPPSGGSSNITGTITGSGTVDENGNITIDNSINIDTTPITDGLDNVQNSIDETHDYISGDTFDENGNPNDDSLVGKIVNALLRIFIPEDGFFSAYFDELMTWFSDRLGLLSFPFEFIIDFFTRIYSADFSDAVIHIPDLYIPLFEDSGPIFEATDFNFHEFINVDDNLKYIYNLYLIAVDGIIVYGLIKLLLKKYEEVMTK